jgi:hypothetical protein
MHNKNVLTSFCYNFEFLYPCFSFNLWFKGNLCCYHLNIPSLVYTSRKFWEFSNLSRKDLWPFSQKFLRILVFSLLTKYLLILVSAFHERLRKYNSILKKNILRTTKSFLDDVLSLSSGNAWLHHVHCWTGDAKDIYAPWMDILRTIWRTEYRNCRGVFLRVQVSV